MKLIVNGEPTELPEATTVTDLLVRRDLLRARCAVAVNGTFVPHDAHETTTLEADDEVEIVAPMAGG